MPRTVEYEPSPRISPNSKSLSCILNPAELFLDLAVRALDLDRDCARLRRSSPSSTSPSSLCKYGGGFVVRGVGGASLLADLGDEKVRSGRGRGVLTMMDPVELDEEEEDITDAFLLRSARVGGLADCSCSCSRSAEGEGEETSMCSI